MPKRHPNHGGAWKVAYADFITAMMALFLVLWLTSQDQKIKEAVQQIFKVKVDDVRGTAAYRRHGCRVLARRAIGWALGERRLPTWL